LESENFKYISLCVTLCKMKRPLVGHPIISADFIFTYKVYKPHLKDAAYEIHLHLDYWFMRRRGLHAFPYTSLCKKKRPLVGSFMGKLYFYVQFTTHVPRMLYVKYQSIWFANSWEEYLQKFTKFYTFCPLLGPNRCQPLVFQKLESLFLKDVPTSWAKKLTDGRTPDKLRWQ